VAVIETEAAAVVVTAAVRTAEVMAVVGAADADIAGPAAAVAKITVSATGAAGVPVTAGAAVITAVTAAEGASADMSHDGQQANTWGVGLSPGGGITTLYLGQGSVEPVEVKATSAVWPGRASGGTLR
jgi:hypothetical protein